MNHLSQKLICLSLLISAVNIFAGTTTNIVPRSQSFNAARQMVGWNNPEWGINRLPQDKWYSSFNLTFAYTKTFRSQALAECLFGDDLVCGPCDDSALKISGSAVADRAKTDWLGDYFGLPRDFQSTVTFKPTISNFILDFSFYAGLDNWVDGMYFRIHGPFVHTNWNLNATECVSVPGTIGYFQGYFAAVEIPATSLNKGFLAYANPSVCSTTISNNYDLYGEDYCLAGTGFDPSCTTLGDITGNSLCCSKINNDCDCKGESINGFGELRMVLGYNFLNNEQGDYHLGFGLYVGAPTGTRVGGEDCGGNYLFAPIVGNGHHWELGGQVTAHHIWWRSEDENKSFGMYLEANITHLFGTCQTRCFDLCSAGSNSRYMLAQQLVSNKNSVPHLSAATDSLGYEFGNVYSPVANLTRRNVTSSIGAQGDVAFTLAYQTGGFQWDLGYNFWGRSCEKLCPKDDCCDQPFGTWALKGDQRVYGFASDLYATHALATRLAATDSKANIHEGSNLKNNVNYQGNLPLAPKNLYADNSTPAITSDNESVFTLPLGTTAIYTSEKSVLISECDINYQGTRGISNKIFTNLNYAWANREGSKWTPYIGFGAEAEFGSSSDKDCCETSCNPCTTTVTCAPCPTNDNCCQNCALSQWGVWFKVGTSYN